VWDWENHGKVSINIAPDGERVNVANPLLGYQFKKDEIQLFTDPVRKNESTVRKDTVAAFKKFVHILTHLFL
jgi:hypothetical protein